MNKFFLLFLIITIFSSCSEYQKALKSEDVAVKYDMAMRLYDSKKYSKAILLIDQIAPSYRGKPQAEKLFYMYAQAYYKTKNYYSAGYQFESFTSTYLKSEKREEAAYLGAKSYFFLSPVYTLDQKDTVKAIDKLQAFIDDYPASAFLPEANELMRSLRLKLEKKAFEIAKQYNTISDYKSAIVVFDNFVSDYPGTSYKEEALYYRLDSAYKLAINSVPSKMKERLNVAKLAYANLMKFKTDSAYKEKADVMLANIDKELQQFSK